MGVWVCESVGVWVCESVGVWGREGEEVDQCTRNLTTCGTAHKSPHHVLHPSSASTESPTSSVCPLYSQVTEGEHSIQSSPDVEGENRYTRTCNWILVCFVCNGI